MDDIRDLVWVKMNQEKLQGKPEGPIEFASTPSGGYAYEHYLYRTPMILTINEDTANQQMLDEDDWLGNPGNRVVLKLDGPPCLVPDEAPVV